jgi:hypothetical protein
MNYFCDGLAMVTPTMNMNREMSWRERASYEDESAAKFSYV